MSATKHTPGPWRVLTHAADGSDDHGTEIIGGTGERGKSIAMVERRRDAILIAAAPALADALLAVWSELNDLLTGKCEGGHPDIDDQTRADMTRIRDGSGAALRAAGRLP